MRFSTFLPALSAPHNPLIVGTIHEEAALAEAVSLPHEAVDLLEWRVDALAQPHQPTPLPPALPAPILVTVRHPAEGGLHGWPANQREAAYLKLLPQAAALDLELRSWHQMPRLRDAARERAVPIIASFHDFAATPDDATLRQIVDQAAEAGASLCKIACQLRDERDLDRLALLLLQSTALPLAVMGMGSLGKRSRLAYAIVGSRLNYGYLGNIQVSGQWHAPRFREHLLEMGFGTE